jgi:hypothetical protein
LALIERSERNADGQSTTILQGGIYLMDDELKRLRDKVDTLELWIVFLVIMLIVSIGWNYYNYRIVQECNDYVSEIKSYFDSFSSLFNSLMGN